MRKLLPFSMIVLFSGASANISGGSDYSKYIQTPEQRISYKIAQYLHEHKIKDEQTAIKQRGIDSLTALIKNIEP